MFRTIGAVAYDKKESNCHVMYKISNCLYKGAEPIASYNVLYFIYAFLYSFLFLTNVV